MENEKPFFSIVIPTYNHGHLIKRCLDSIVAQTYIHWEAIVVNNYSNDNTVEIVESYRDPRIRLVNNANHGIIAVSRNKGIELAKGDWICFLDSDDWWTCNKLEACIPFLTNYDLIYTDMFIRYNAENHGLKTLRGYQVNKRDPYKEMLLRGNPCVNSSVVCRKSVIEKIGYLSADVNLIAVEDFDYWLRMAWAKVRFKHIKKCLGYYWLGNGNLSFNKKQVNRMEALYEKHLMTLTFVRVHSNSVSNFLPYQTIQKTYSIAQQIWGIGYSKVEMRLKYLHLKYYRRFLFESHKLKKLYFISFSAILCPKKILKRLFK